MYPILSIVVFLLTAIPVLAQEAEQWDSDQQEVFEAIVARNNAWAENDFETFISLTHPRWLRWSMQSEGMMARDDYARFWDDIKTDEEIRSMHVDPVAIEVFGDAAVAHFITTEELVWQGEPRQIDDKVLEAGEPFTVRLRWSEFLVAEDGRWLVVGGHRDGLCQLRDDMTTRADEICRE